MKEDPGGESGDSSGSLDVARAGRSHPLVDDFASALRAEIDVPEKIYHLRRSGAARATITRSAPGKWITLVHGEDSYARAIITKALESLPKNSIGMEKLDKSDWKSVDVYFSFQWLNKFAAVEKLNNRDAIPDTKVSGNRIQIAIERIGGEEELNPSFRRAMVLLPLAFGIVDLMGIYGELKTPADSGPKWDPAVRRLEQSAAFIKPMFTFPLGAVTAK